VRLFDRAVVHVLPAVPRSIVRRVAAPYIAGPTLDDARRVVADLNGQDMRATVDVLGEEIARPDEAEAIARAYHDALAAIEQDGLDANISIKLTGFGLKLDPALCRALVTELVGDAERRGIFVRIDMEDSSTTDETLDLYRALRGVGHERVGVVLQAALRRTSADIEALAPLRPSVRLCKGIYLEPEAIAFQEFDEVRQSFVDSLDALFGAGCRVGIATHDEWLIEQALERVAALDESAYEMQMLLGVRPERARSLVAEGHPLRIYVPYGHQWYEYSLRRLQENPKVAGYVANDVLRRLVPFRKGRA
jgi:proline dehydrogenase